MTLKPPFVRNNLKEWPKLFRTLPVRQQKAVYMTSACAAVFLVVAVASTLLIFGGAKNPAGSANPLEFSILETGYNKDANTVPPEEMARVALLKTADSGQEYLSETLFVGDTNTVALHELYQLLPLENYMGMVGMTVQDSTTMPCVFFKDDITIYTIPEALKMAQPSRIMLSLGASDAMGKAGADSFIKQYKAAIKTLQTAYPDGQIILTSILPRGVMCDYPSVSQKKIDAFNKALVKLCEELSLEYLNTAEALKDETTGYAKKEYLSADGARLSEAGGRALLSYVRTHASAAKDKHQTTGKAPERQEPPAPTAGTIVLPTCVGTGYTPYTLWNKTVDRGDVVPALGHNFANGVCLRCGVKQPKGAGSGAASNTKGASDVPIKGVTSLDDKNTTSSASLGDTSKKSASSSAPAHVHDFSVQGSVITQATCYEVGKQSFFCSADDGVAEIRELPMLKHRWVWRIDSAPTTAAPGEQHQLCTVGGEKRKLHSVIPQLAQNSVPA